MINIHEEKDGIVFPEDMTSLFLGRLHNLIKMCSVDPSLGKIQGQSTFILFSLDMLLSITGDLVTPLPEPNDEMYRYLGLY